METGYWIEGQRITTNWWYIVVYSGGSELTSLHPPVLSKSHFFSSLITRSHDQAPEIYHWISLAALDSSSKKPVIKHTKKLDKK